MQKFFKGDLVRIAKDLGPSMSHFEKDCEAVVMYTYAEAYGPGRRNETQYSLVLLPSGAQVSWYDEDQLTLIEGDGFMKLPKNNYDRRVEEARRARNA